MNGLVPITGIAAIVATLLMVLAMLYLVWLSTGEGTHGPNLDPDRPEFGEQDDEESQPEVTDGTSA